MKREKLLFDDCALSNAIATLGSRWKPLIVCCLKDKKMRFGQLAAVMAPISRKVLTDQLRELENDGILIRDESKAASLRVEYSLTPKGRDLAAILITLEAWGRGISAGVRSESVV